MNKLYKIDMVINTLTPLTQIENKQKGVSYQIKQYINIKNNEGLTAKVEHPIITPNSLKSKFRAAVVDAIFEKYVGKEHVFDLYDILVNRLGGTISGSSQRTTQDNILANEIKNKNLIIDIFGACIGKIPIPAKFSISCTTVCKETISNDEALEEKFPISDYPNAVDMIGYEFITRQNVFIDTNKPYFSLLTEEGQKQYEKYNEDAKATKVRNDKKKNEDKKNEDEVEDKSENVNAGNIQQIQSNQVINPGNKFFVQILLRNATVEELGLIIYGLDRFALDPQIGSYKTRGNGIVNVDDGKVYERSEVKYERSEVKKEEVKKEEPKPDWIQLGTFKISGLNQSFKPEGLDDFIIVANEYINNLKTEDLKTVLSWFKM